MRKPKTIIIAEAGVNHNGDIKIAKKLVDIAKKHGADFIKFQAFKADLLTTGQLEKASYQKNTVGVGFQQEMLKNLELPFSHLKELQKYSKKEGIGFMLSGFDDESLKFMKTLKLDYVKVPSGEIDNVPYLRKVASMKRKIILSTGMSFLKEVEFAIKTLKKAGIPKKDLTILHCNTEYPTPLSDVNLRAMLTLKDKLRVDVGYSDHTNSTEVSMCAVALGARIIEKHITLDKKMPGPDHSSSIEPDELHSFIKSIRLVEKILGSRKKVPSRSEKKNIPFARKVIVASKFIKKGSAFTENNLTAKRAGKGLSPSNWDIVLKKRAKKDFQEEERIKI
tara:strand:+ start:14786 stop:15793 length:1008 start_codon:yes stop_codon:yes gene_type:complete